MNYNSQSFTPEEVEQGLHMDLINYLLSYNQKAEKSYFDIHITTDSYCTIVEWCDCYYDDSYGNGQFRFVDEDQIVMTECRLPDNSIVMCYDEDDAKEHLDDFLKEHPTYKQNEYGRWYDERDVIDFKRNISEEIVDSISKGILND